MNFPVLLNQLRIGAGVILLISGTLLLMLMLLLPGMVMVVLGMGLLVNQLLRSTRMLAALAAMLMLYSLAAKQSYPLATSWVWFGLAFFLLLYALFAAKLSTFSLFKT